MPLVGHLLKLIGVVEAKPSCISRALEEGVSLGICPGGIGEMFVPQSQPGKEFALSVSVYTIYTSIQSSSSDLKVVKY